MKKIIRRPYGAHYRDGEFAAEKVRDAAAVRRRSADTRRTARLLPRALLVALLMVALMLPVGNILGPNRPVLAETGAASGQNGTTSTSQSAADTSAKDEVVYGMLESDGTPKQG